MSVRLSYTDANADGVIDPGQEIVAENNYYPFGLQHRGYNELPVEYGNKVAEQYRFNGKEYNDAFGLNIYEMDWRQYDPAIARWTVMDPVTHYEFSPYSAFDNNPAFWSDPSGADAVETSLGFHYTGQDAADIFSLLAGNIKQSKIEIANMYGFDSFEDLISTIGAESDGGGGGSGQSGLSPESFYFQKVTGNWQAAGVTNLLLSVTNKNGKIKNVTFEIEVGLPVVLKNKIMISERIAKTAGAKAANQAAIDIGSMAYLSNGKFYESPALVQKTFSSLMQTHLNIILTDMLDIDDGTKIGSRVNSPIQSNIQSRQAIWHQVSVIDQIRLIMDRFF